MGGGKMSVKVYISKNAIDGILRVIEAQYKHLPQFDVEIVKFPHQADIICNHGAMLETFSDVPLVNINHGLYWSRQPWGDDMMDTNRQVVRSMINSVEMTAPSDWVNQAIRRGGFWYPETVYHGIDGDEFLPSKTHENYVLWNKARADYVSDPRDMQTIAMQMLGTQFVTTIGKSQPNVNVIGRKTHGEMKNVVSEAGVYLATVRETFGIATLEALAYGVPIAGWDWGGTSEIVIQGVTGYLAPPGDWNALEECIRKCFAEREYLSRNAIEDARTRWKWFPRIEQYANIFHRVHQGYNVHDRRRVSIIVTAYHLDEFLPDCLNSVSRQTFKDFECIVVDDGNLESTKKIVEEYAKQDKRFIYHATPENLGLPKARNFGLARSNGKYIRHVDADDFLADNAIELEVKALDQNGDFSIVYGHLEVINPDGSRRVDRSGEPIRSGWPERHFNWYRQMSHLNQLPSCSMARREVYERSGGYRTRMHRNEDAEFWCRVTSLGFHAIKFTEAVTYFHRERNDSKGAKEWQEEGGEPDWTSWFPWRMGASGYESAMTILRKNGENPPNPHLVPFGAQGRPPKNLGFWYVHDYSYPKVSIIMTCGPRHQPYLQDALDSIQAQNYPDWECILVNDTGEAWGKDIMGAPWAKVVNMEGNQGTSAARNAGLKKARGEYIVWMDADDYWLPWFLEKMVGYAERNFGVIFSDLIFHDEGEKFTIYRYPEFQSELVPQKMRYPGSSILVPKKIADRIMERQGGFDLEIPGMEDWDYQIAVHDAGFCAFHVPEPLFVYRRYSSTKRDNDFGRIEEIRQYIDQKWRIYRSGEKKLMCGCKSTKKPMAPQPSSLMSSSGNFDMQTNVNPTEAEKREQMVTIEYLGDIKSPFSIKSKMDGNVRYRFADDEFHKVVTVFLGDAQFLLGQLSKSGLPLYRIISGVQTNSNYAPTEFLGHPIAA